MVMLFHLHNVQVGRSLVAYATLPESVSTAQLAPGTVFNTTAAISLTPITITAAQPNPLTGQITVRPVVHMGLICDMLWMSCEYQQRVTKRNKGCQVCTSTQVISLVKTVD